MADKVSIYSISLLTSIVPSDMPLIILLVQSISNSYYLDLLSIKYNNQYLSSLIENNGTYQNVKIDSYKIEKSNKSESKEDYWSKLIKNLFAHYRLFIKTLSFPCSWETNQSQIRVLLNARLLQIFWLSALAIK